MPRETRVNFTDYVDVAELVTAAVVPQATYVAGTIRLDYSNAEVFVEASEQFIVAEVHPVDEKDIRVRGPLVDVNEDEETQSSVTSSGVTATS